MTFTILFLLIAYLYGRLLRPDHGRAQMERCRWLSRVGENWATFADAEWANPKPTSCYVDNCIWSSNSTNSISTLNSPNLLAYYWQWQSIAKCYIFSGLSTISAWWICINLMCFPGVFVSNWYYRTVPVGLESRCRSGCLEDRCLYAKLVIIRIE